MASVFCEAYSSGTVRDSHPVPYYALVCTVSAAKLMVFFNIITFGTTLFVTVRNAEADYRRIVVYFWKKLTTMASIKVKFRPSVIEGHKGLVYYQIIHGRKVRAVGSGHYVLPDEWDSARREFDSCASKKIF